MWQKGVLLAMIFLLPVAGHDKTVNLIAEAQPASGVRPGASG